MERSHLILLFAAAFFLVLTGFGIYTKLSQPDAPTTAPTTTQAPLVERLREERERRMRERGELPDPSSTQPATAPVTGN